MKFENFKPIDIYIHVHGIHIATWGVVGGSRVLELRLPRALFDGLALRENILLSRADVPSSEPLEFCRVNSVMMRMDWSENPQRFPLKRR